ncbi:MAG TPA: hypothetical protein PKC91_13025, partial [Ignavibacteria bacterium]|nr:hypothetical protein [Ignavibacteria bacterium]
DWLSSNSVIFSGSTKPSSALHKQVDVKLGEDNILYALINSTGSGIIHGQFYIYKSTNFGMNWSYVYGVGTGGYLGNLSLLVESRSNANPDSTRLIIFYTSSSVSTNNSASLNYYSLRTDASAITSGTIDYPEAGKSFTHISTVSDGAYWQNATYFGVVVSESDNITGDTQRLRFYRTIDWGATWVSSQINTFQNDLHPSAEYKEGSSDSVYIAVERKFSSTNSEIRVIATPWNPSTSFNVYYLTNSALRYENPCLSVKQEGNADSILITCTRNGYPVYHFTSNGGSVWNIDYSIAPSNGSNKAFTYCSSSRTGENPFSVCWVSDDGDSINVRRGVLGNLGQNIHKVNSINNYSTTVPVCVTIPSSGSNNTIVAYAGSSSGVYSAQEGYKTVNIKLMPQGYYDQVTNTISMKDTVRLYLRSTVSPYGIIDSAKAVFDTTGFNAAFKFAGLSDGEYYFDIKHRNSIETWSSLPVYLALTDINDYNFTTSASTAFGNNLINVDNSPVRFAVYSGDANQDGYINLTDVLKVYNDASSFVTGYESADVTGNKIVDLTDLLITYNNSANFVSLQRP